MQVITAHMVGKTQTFAIYTIIRDGSQRGNVCKHAHSCRLQSVCDVKHYHIWCGKTKCVIVYLSYMVYNLELFVM